MSKQYHTALVIGRFQPFHNGHLYLLEKSLEMADYIKIAIGSANSTDRDANPLSYQQRKQMIKTVIKHEGWENRVTDIFASNDFESDEEWRVEIIQKAGQFDIAVGNNDWTNSVLAEAGYQTKTITLKDREHLQGVVIRKLIRSNEDWQSRVPDYLVNTIMRLT